MALAEGLKKNKTIIFIAIAVIIVLFYLKSHAAGQTAAPSTSDATSGNVSFTGGGEVAPPMDPGTASVMSAEIGAQTADFQTAAQTILGSQQSTDALTAATIQSNNNLTLGLAQNQTAQTVGTINANNQLAIAQLNNNAQMFQIQAQKDIARANDNTKIAQSAFGFVGNVVHYLSLGLF